MRVLLLAIFLTGCAANTSKAAMDVAIGVGVRCEGACEVTAEVAGTREGDVKEVKTQSGVPQ